MELKSRRVHLAGVTRNPDDMFMGKAVEGALDFLRGTRFLICDRDTKFSLRFRLVLEAAGVKLVRTPYQAPMRALTRRGGCAPSRMSASTA